MSLVTEGLGGGSGGSAPTVINVEMADQFTVRIEFNEAVVLTGNAAVPANWIIVPESEASKNPTVSDIDVDGSVVDLTVTSHTHLADYTLTIPTGIANEGGNIFLGDFDQSYEGVGSAITVVMSRSVNARLLEVIFSEPVNEADALTPGNYSISPTLTISGVSQITPVIYQLVTSKQGVGTSYTISISDIRERDT